MNDDADDLFVIDKKGAEEAHSSNILYHFKPEEVHHDEPKTESKPIRQRRGPSGKRYHEAEDFEKFRPGTLSRELRKALDLARHEIPIHVYRMRTLGYPPGWLRKAQVGGGLAIFDSVTALTEDKEVTYNRDALVSYPGFNTELEYPYVDQSRQLHCPPMQSHHMLDNFYSALSRNSRVRSDHNQPQVPQDLDKLREERERILAEIRRLDSTIAVSQTVEREEIKVEGRPANEQPPLNDCNASEPQDLSSTPIEINGEVIKSHQSPNQTDSNDQVLSISATEDGTPTPQGLYRNEGSVGDDNSSSGPAKRPSIDAFTVGVQPFRPFENLPGSQGGYQRVLQTLRNSRAETTTDGQSTHSTNKRSSDSVSSRDHSSTPYSPRSGHHRNADSTNSSASSHFRASHNHRYNRLY